jgi:RHS repeat-associated protein
LPGQENDVETALYHNGFRDYVSGLGRYLESDPIGLAGGLNPYHYANANPESHLDPFGLSGDDVYNEVYALINDGLTIATQYIPRGSSLLGPLRFLDINAHLGGIYTDLNCHSSRSALSRSLDAISNALGIAAPFSGPFSGVLTYGSLGFGGEAMVDDNPDAVLNNKIVSWLFAKVWGLDYR